jgi:hypothetical protein
MYKRQNKGNSAWRVGVGSYYRVDDSLWTALRDVGSHYNLNGNFSLGYEWQQPISKKWLVYYGVDVAVSLQYKKFVGDRSSGIIVNNQVVDMVGFEENYTITPTIRPFFGGRFQLYRRFYLAVETALQIIYEQQQKNIFFTSSVKNVKQNEEQSKYGLSFQPYSGVYVFYLF